MAAQGPNSDSVVCGRDARCGDVANCNVCKKSAKQRRHAIPLALRPKLAQKTARAAGMIEEVNDPYNILVSNCFAEMRNSGVLFQRILSLSILCFIVGFKIPVDQNGKTLLRSHCTRHEIAIGEDVYEFFVNNIEVNTSGPDDNIYLKHPEIVTICPRSLSITYIFKNGVFVKTVRICNFQKFFANNKNEEDEQPDGGFYVDENAVDDEDVIGTRFIWTEKANGKQFTFKIIELDGHRFLLGGSKARHIPVLITENPEIKTHHNLIVCIVRLFIAEWFKMSEAKQNDLVRICKTFSLCGEYLDGKHFIAEDKPKLVFFGLCEPHKPACDMFKAIGIFDSLGLKTVQCEIMNFEELNKKRDAARYSVNSEGGVIHYQKLIDGEFVVIKMEKFKTYWYILLRMLREYMKNYQNVDGVRAITFEKKICTARQSFMNITDEFAQFWIKLTGEFIKWFDENSNVKDLDFNGDFGFAEVWDKFMSQTGISDEF